MPEEPKPKEQTPRPPLSEDDFRKKWTTEIADVEQTNKVIWDHLQLTLGPDHTKRAIRDFKKRAAVYVGTLSQLVTRACAARLGIMDTIIGLVRQNTVLSHENLRLTQENNRMAVLLKSKGVAVHEVTQGGIIVP